MAEALISKGYGKALRHRQDDDLRSSCYDELLSAEARAEKNRKGLFNKKEYTPIKVADFSGVSRMGRENIRFEWLSECYSQCEDSGWLAGWLVVCVSVCLSVYLCEYMDLVLGGDCLQSADKFVVPAWWLAVCSDPANTPLPHACCSLPPFRILPKLSTSCPSSRERGRPQLSLRCGGWVGWGGWGT